MAVIPEVIEEDSSMKEESLGIHGQPEGSLPEIREPELLLNPVADNNDKVSFMRAVAPMKLPVS